MIANILFCWLGIGIGIGLGYFLRAAQEARVAYLLFTPENLPPFNPILPCPKCGGAAETGHGVKGALGPYTFCPYCLVLITKSAR